MNRNMAGAAFLLLVGVVPLRAAEPVPISDYMIMDVCVDASDRILPALMPGDAGCERRRDIRVGETPPYELRNFLNPGRACAEDGGTVQKLNRPVERDGETRIVSSTITLPPNPAAAAAGRPSPARAAPRSSGTTTATASSWAATARWRRRSTRRRCAGTAAAPPAASSAAG